MFDNEIAKIINENADRTGIYFYRSDRKYYITVSPSENYNGYDKVQGIYEYSVNEEKAIFETKKLFQ